MAASAKPTLRARMRAVTAETLLDAAERTMVQLGYERATMQEMAAAAGCATGTLYLYFANKKELFEAVVARHANRMFTGAIAQRAACLDAIGRLKAGLIAVLRYAQQHRPFFRLLFTAMPMRKRTMQQMIGAAARRHHDRFRETDLVLLRQAQDEGSVRRDLPPEILVDFLGDLGMGMVEQFTFSPKRVSLDEQVRIVWGLMSNGIGCREQA
jgi:AcrR family transcriptional regulator